MIPYDRGTYCDIYPSDRCENIRRDICLSLEEMGIKLQVHTMSKDLDKMKSIMNIQMHLLQQII